MDYKFKIGDKVELIAKSDISELQLGTQGVIIKYDPLPYPDTDTFYQVSFGVKKHYIEEYNLKLIEDESKAI